MSKVAAPAHDFGDLGLEGKPLIQPNDSMNKALKQARYERSMQIINKFAPEPDMTPQAPISRSDVISDIYRILSRRTLRDASNEELAAIYTALKAAKHRGDK